MKKKTIPFEKNVHYGKELFSIQNQLRVLLLKISKQCTFQSKEGRIIEKMLGPYSQLHRLRSELEDKMYREHPGKANVYVYYPGETKCKLTGVNRSQ